MAGNVIRVGLLGASAIAPYAVIGPASRRSDVVVQAVAARDRARAGSYASEHGIAHVLDDYDALLARGDIDLVYVALPASEHARWSIAALEAGKAVLCEKPLATSGIEALRMFAVASAAGRPLWEAMHYRFHPAMRRVVELCRTRAVGDLLRVDARFDARIRDPHDIRWRRELGGGALLDLGCYAVHAVRSVLGDPLAVEGAHASFRDGVDARLSAQLRSRGGVPVGLSCSMVDEEFTACLMLRGTRGELRFDRFVCPDWEGRLQLTVDGRSEELPVDPRPTYDWQLDHVVGQLLSGVDTGEAATDSCGNVCLIEAILRAANGEHGDDRADGADGPISPA